MTLTTKIFSILLLAFALGACGQSGPLYVPGDPSEIQTTQPVPEADENGEENGEEDAG
jgi:predicted small lipoprotein YifL